MTLQHTFALVLAGISAVFGGNAAHAEPLIAEAIINAPLATVWQGFAAREGYASVGIQQASIDLKMGGLVQVAADPQTTTVSEIVAFEPERLLSLKVRQPPAGFPNAGAFANTWSIVYFAPLGAEMTHVRIAGFGFNEGPAAAELTRFFLADQAAQLTRLEKHYWPLCALCKKE